MEIKIYIIIFEIYNFSSNSLMLKNYNTSSDHNINYSVSSRLPIKLFPSVLPSYKLRLLADLSITLTEGLGSPDPAKINKILHVCKLES